jgi:hypothetical protein
MFYDDQIYGCAFGCPFQHRYPDCPLADVDHLTIREKVNWVNSLIKEQKAKIMEKHLLCFERRERHNF